MNIVELIEKKRDGRALTADEIKYVVMAYLQEVIPDYQMSALLMAIYFRGMNDEETVALTRWMRDSGVVLNFSHLAAPKIDKHSTGGVGDKVSLILAPLLAAARIHVPMISGRGLGHTGGTLDKLESIPGFRTQLSLREFRVLTEKIGTCLIGQTQEICPADRRLYALRDVTGTVPALPLICASILSKKLAEGLDGLVLDVKVGQGAIFAQAERAEELALRLIRTAAHFGLPVRALLTDMSQPLGRAVGNWLEVREAIAVLRNEGPEDVRKVTLALGAAMLQAAGEESDLRLGMRKLEALLLNGAAWEKFQEVVVAQGGDVQVVRNPGRYPPPRYALEIKADRSGCLARLEPRTLGRLAMSLGAGRANLEQEVDPWAGLTLHKKVGDCVNAGDLLATLQSSTIMPTAGLADAVRGACTVSDEPAAPPSLLHAMFAGEERLPIPA